MHDGGNGRVTQLSTAPQVLCWRIGRLRRERFVRGRILLALGLAALLGGAAVIAVRATSSHGPAVAPARPVVVGRVLLNGHGVPGAHVTLYALPNQAVMASLKPGEKVPVIVVGSAVSSGSGSYSISTANWAGLRGAATNGKINFQVIATDGCRAWPYFFPRELVRTATGPALAVADNAAGTPTPTVQHADLRLPARASGNCAGGSAS
jgi:hypothetical protein